MIEDKIFKWWCNLDQRDRNKIIKEAYENW